MVLHLLTFVGEFRIAVVRLCLAVADLCNLWLGYGYAMGENYDVQRWRCVIYKIGLKVWCDGAPEIGDEKSVKDDHLVVSYRNEASEPNPDRLPSNLRISAAGGSNSSSSRAHQLDNSVPPLNLNGSLFTLDGLFESLTSGAIPADLVLEYAYSLQKDSENSAAGSSTVLPRNNGPVTTGFPHAATNPMSNAMEQELAPEVGGQTLNGLKAGADVVATENEAEAAFDENNVTAATEVEAPAAEAEDLVAEVDATAEEEAEEEPVINEAEVAAAAEAEVEVEADEDDVVNEAEVVVTADPEVEAIIPAADEVEEDAVPNEAEVAPADPAAEVEVEVEAVEDTILDEAINAAADAGALADMEVEVIDVPDPDVDEGGEAILLELDLEPNEAQQPGDGDHPVLAPELQDFGHIPNLAAIEHDAAEDLQVPVADEFLEAEAVNEADEIPDAAGDEVQEAQEQAELPVANLHGLQEEAEDPAADADEVEIPLQLKVEQFSSVSVFATFLKNCNCN